MDTEFTEYEVITMLVSKAKGFGYKDKQVYIEHKQFKTNYHPFEKILFQPEFMQALVGLKWKFHIRKLAVMPPEQRINYLAKKFLKKNYQFNKNL